MGLFQKAHPEMQMKAKLESKKTERDKLAGRLTGAEAAGIAAISATTKLAVGGADDAALDSAEAKGRAISDRIKTLKSALVEADAELLALGQELDKHRDKAQRAETAAECETMALDLENLLPLVEELFTPMAEIGKRAVAAQIWSGVDLERFAITSKDQIPTAIQVLTKALRYHAQTVLAGQKGATLIKPNVPAPKLVEVLPPTRNLLTTRNVCWVDHKGVTQTAGKFSDVNLPVAVAARALASGACRETGDDFWRQWSGTKGYAKPEASECVNLDEDIASSTFAEIVPADPRLQLVDRGPPVTLHVAKG